MSFINQLISKGNTTALIIPPKTETCFQKAQSRFQQLPRRIKYTCSGVVYTGISLASLATLKLVYSVEACYPSNKYNLYFNCHGSTSVSLSLNVSLPGFALASGYKVMEAFDSTN